MLIGSLTLAQLVFVIAISGLVSLTCCYIGVWGTEKLQNRRITDLELDIEHLRASLKSFVKTVSGRMGQEEKRAKLSVVEDAKSRLAQESGTSDDEWIHGKIR